MESKPKDTNLQDYLGHVSQEHEVRVQKVKEMREAGIDPWPKVRAQTAQAVPLVEQYKEGDETEYQLVGRIMSIRLHGKAAFVNLQDNSGKIQVYLKEDLIGGTSFRHFERFVDIGDIIWVRGTLFKTQRGEISIRAVQ
jgi:lysyl-tRNA synthetase class 2